MTTERWQRLESICHAALARPAEERAAFVAEACGGDHALRQEAESLVARAGLRVVISGDTGERRHAANAQGTSARTVQM